MGEGWCTWGRVLLAGGEWHRRPGLLLRPGRSLSAGTTKSPRNATLRPVTAAEGCSPCCLKLSASP